MLEAQTRLTTLIVGATLSPTGMQLLLLPVWKEGRGQYSLQTITQSIGT